jgi:hypothetical protein
MNQQVVLMLEMQSYRFYVLNIGIIFQFFLSCRADDRQALTVWQLGSWAVGGILKKV